MSKQTISIRIEESWKVELDEIAWQRAVKEKRYLTYADLIREAIDEKYKFSSSLLKGEKGSTDFHELHYSP